MTKHKFGKSIIIIKPAKPFTYIRRIISTKLLLILLFFIKSFTKLLFIYKVISLAKITTKIFGLAKNTFNIIDLEIFRFNFKTCFDTKKNKINSYLNYYLNQS